MPITPCAPCSCVPGNIPNDKFKQDIEVILCGILTALGGGSTPGAPINITNSAPYVHTQPTIATATSVTLVPANPNRRSITIQNNSAANVMINLAGATLTGIVPTASNKGIVLLPTGAYTSPANSISPDAITIYQTSGGSINTVSVMEQS